MSTERNTTYSSLEAPTRDSPLGLSGGGNKEKDGVCWTVKTRSLIIINPNIFSSSLVLHQASESGFSAFFIHCKMMDPDCWIVWMSWAWTWLYIRHLWLLLGCSGSAHNIRRRYSTGNDISRNGILQHSNYYLWVHAYPIGKAVILVSRLPI